MKLTLTIQILFGIVLLHVVQCSFAQDAYFSQYNSFPLHLDKALAGSAGGPRIVAGTRLQWLNFDGGYRTNYFSYDQYSRHIKSGFGVEYYHGDESNGLIKNNFIYLTFSPTISLGKRLDDSLKQFVIKPAVNVGYLNYSVDFSRLSFGDNIDPGYGFIYNSSEIQNAKTVAAPDFGAGLAVYGKTFFAGFYYHHILQPELAFLFEGSFLFSRIVFHGGYLLNKKWLGKFTLVPSFVYEIQGSSTRTEISLSAKYKKYIFGMSEHFTSSVVFMAGFEHQFLTIRYAYDLNTTRISKIVGPTHEILLGFKFARREKLKKIRTLQFLGM